MRRLLTAVLLVALAVSLAFGAWWFLAFPVVLVGGVAVGVPSFLSCRRLGWLLWWHAVLVGLLAAAPVVAIYLKSNPGHAEHVGVYNAVVVIGAGLLAGYLVWLLGVFRNPAFGDRHAAFPRTSLLLLPLLGLLTLYRSALAPEYLHGCITDFELAESPRSWRHAYITVITDEGERFRDGIPVGYSDPALVGRCAFGSKKRVPSLHRYYFTVHSVDVDGCTRRCRVR